jgi:hypothetical protein
MSNKNPFFATDPPRRRTAVEETVYEETHTKGTRRRTSTREKLHPSVQVEKEHKKLIPERRGSLREKDTQKKKTTKHTQAPQESIRVKAPPSTSKDKLKSPAPEVKHSGTSKSTTRQSTAPKGKKTII